MDSHPLMTRARPLPSVIRGPKNIHDPKTPASGHVHFAGRRHGDGDGAGAGSLARWPGSVTGGGGRWLMSPASICPK